MPAVGPFDKDKEPPRLKRVEEGMREVIGGDRRAAVRRILLWMLVIALIAMGAPLWLSLMPIALLITTDDLL